MVIVTSVALAASAEAQDSRRLPAPEVVPLHSTIDVSTLAAAPDAKSGAIREKVQPRRRPNPQGLQELKSSPERLPEGGPGTVGEPRADVVAPASTLSVISAFEGLANLPDNVPLTGGSVIPSDANLAAGPTQVFEMVNIVGRITNKSGGAVSTFSLGSFFGVDAGFDETDPQVLYDATSGRWFATYAEFNDTQRQSSIILAVSTSSDATGTFCRFRLGNPTVETFAQDFPHVGVSDDKVVVTYNAFNFANDNFLGAGYYVLNKAELVATAGGCPASVNRVRVAPNVARYGLHPAQSLSSTTTQYVAMNGDGSAGSSTLRVFSITGQPGVTSVTETSVALGIRFWGVPPNARQAGSSVLLDTGDASVFTAMWRNGSLWVGGNEACTPAGDTVQRSCLRLIEVATGSLAVQQDLTFASATEYLYYPALAPDAGGNLVVVFNGSSQSTFAGVRVAGRLVNDPPDTLTSSIVLRAGGGAQTDPSGRMGDYSGAAVDPSDPTTVWVTSEYIRATASRDWGTFVARVRLTAFAPPSLALALNGVTFRPGNTLSVNLTVGNPGGVLQVDVYFAILLPASAGLGLGCPAGDAVAFFTSGFSSLVIRCGSGSPATFPTFAAAASLPAGLPPTTFTNFFSFVWPASVPAGQYVIVVLFTVPGAFADGTIDPGDIVGIAAAPATFVP